MNTSDHLPLARSNGLVTETIGAEMIIYDGVSTEAHCLAPLAAAVFAAADGRTSVVDLAAIASAELGEPVDVSSVELALAELEAKDLIVAPPAGAGVSRREALRRAAVLGGAAFAAPLVASLATPAYGAASSLTSLSYVAVLFNVNGTCYREKFSPGEPTVCGGTFATPGTNCDLNQTGCVSVSPDCLPGVTISQNTSTSPSTITVTYPQTFAGHPVTLTRVHVKCANVCVDTDPPKSTCGAGMCTASVTGCR